MIANMIRDPRIVPDCCNRVFVTSLFVFHSLYPYLMILDREIVYDLCNHAWNMSKQFSTQRLMGYTPPSEQWLREKRWESRYKRVSRIHAYDGKPMPLLRLWTRELLLAQCQSPTTRLICMVERFCLHFTDRCHNLPWHNTSTLGWRIRDFDLTSG